MASVVRYTVIASLVMLLAGVQPAAADELPTGERTVYLVSGTGEEQPVGTIRFQPQPTTGSIIYSLDMDYRRFKDFFLSMKEMKCLEGPELWCHIPYPYTNPHTVSASGLGWLEHDLLFMFKGPKEFGANFWNGIYYRMTASGGVIRGKAMAVDLNKLASPPDDTSRPPLGEYDIDAINRDERWLPDLIIR